MSNKDILPVYGENTRKLWQLFNSHADKEGLLIETKIRPLLNSIGLYPTHFQKRELVHHACKCMGRTPEDHLIYGEFCLLVTELQRHYKQCDHDKKSRLKQQNSLSEAPARRLTLKFTGKLPKFQVFLGGACNPTTWRHAQAIPYLEKHGITYYNPQVSYWTPAMMPEEAEAQETANLLFFVIDNKTRSTASMVEAAYLAGCGRQLILIIREFEGCVIIAGEELSDKEKEALHRSHMYLTDLVERMCIPVYNDLDHALRGAVTVLKNNTSVADLTVEDGAQPVKFPDLRVSPELIKLKEAFDRHGCHGGMRSPDIKNAYKCATDCELPDFVSSLLDPRMTYNFSDFCCLVAECRQQKKSLLERFSGYLSKISLKASASMFSQPCNRHAANNVLLYDIYLGGSCGNSRWREDIAIPIIQQSGLSYYNPYNSDWNLYHIPQEAAAKRNCRLYAFVITSTTRALASMIEAGHHIGQQCNVVVCLHDIKHGTCIDDEELTENAVKDYNRARLYLNDLAIRNGVKVFNDTAECIRYSIEAVRST